MAKVLEVLWADGDSICIMWQGREIIIAASEHAFTLNMHMPQDDYAFAHDYMPKTAEGKRVISIIANATAEIKALEVKHAA